jgi:hypothetical protein
MSQGAIVGHLPTANTECGQATVAQLTTKESKAEATLPITIEIIDLSH